MPKPVVLDASAWLAALLQEEGAEFIESALESHPLFAPELIRYETANGILSARKRGRTSSNHTLERQLEIIREFPIQTVPLEAWWPPSARLAEKHDLTFYDAAYLASALVLGTSILTLDKKILLAARSEKIEPFLHAV